MEILDDQKKTLNSNSKNEFDVVLNQLFAEVQNEGKLCYNFKIKDFKNYELISSLSEKEKNELLLYSISARVLSILNEKHIKNGYIYSIFLDELARILLLEITLNDSNIEKLINIFIANSRAGRIIYKWPIAVFINQIILQRDDIAISDSLVSNMVRLRNAIYYYNDKEEIKIIKKIDSFLLFHTNSEDAIKSTLFLGQDGFSEYVDSQIEKYGLEEKTIWHEIVRLTQKKSGSKPTKKFLKSCSELLCKINIDNFQNEIIKWFEFIIHSEGETSTPHGMGAFSVYPVNVSAVKGLIWMCSLLNDRKLIYTISKLAERSFKKNPNLGPTSPTLGKACLYSLYKMKNSESIEQLSRLKLNIKQNKARKIIDKLLVQVTDTENQCVSVDEVEDVIVDIV